MQKKVFSPNIKRLLLVILCAVITISVCADLFFVYKPNQNALGALGTVCMDLISMIVLVILAISLSFEQGEISRTTKLYIGLTVLTIWALFWDFLTWASDGALVYGGWTYFFTISSLVCGSLLALVFILYLSSYMDEMYGMKRVYIGARVCVLLNALDFLFTIILAVTNKAFVFVDGHYETGVLYDLITVIPILTLMYMTAYAVINVKTIGLHDVLAVTGYIAIMIAGAVIETIYRVGATYVGVAIANVYIYVMLQNKLLGRIKKQKELLAEKISSQYEVLDSMAGIYSYVNYVDLKAKTAKRFDVKDAAVEKIDFNKAPYSSLNKSILPELEEDMKEKFLLFTNLNTLSERMKGEKIITSEFCHKTEGWFRAQYIRIGDSLQDPIKKVIYAVRNIDEEKKNVEKWIRKSNTDELTGFFNRAAYEDEITSLKAGPINDNFVYASIDINSLKIVNDTLGHEAGDELIKGACECMKQCFGSYGKLFRTGGDEFAALIYADEKQLEAIKRDLEEVTDNWQGKLVEQVTVSAGYVTRKEVGDLSLHRIAVLADKRMYEAKTLYYQKKGIDRRGQRDAHVALCALYAKILKVNVTDNSYQIINVNEDEKNLEMGFATTLSQWMENFANVGMVHPDDVSAYLEQTNIDRVGEYFKNSKEPLKVFYRRKKNDGYSKVMLEMIPANDYQDDWQSLFLYVKDIE